MRFVDDVTRRSVLPDLSPQLAKKYHPDRNKGDTDAAKQFTKIGEAYEVRGTHTHTHTHHTTPHTHTHTHTRC